MTELNGTQEKVLDFLVDFLAFHDYPPSIRDIKDGCCLSSTSVAAYSLTKLEMAGYIRRDAGVSRAIELLNGYGERRTRTVGVPVLGRIAAYIPLPANPDAMVPEEIIELTDEQTRGYSNLYALRVQGTSLMDALMQDGDIVVLSPRATAEPGEMVVVWLEDRGETTFKKYYPEGSRVRLQPMNSTMEPLYEDARNVRVQARVIAMVRL